MPFTFSKRSEDKLGNLHPDLVRVVRRVLGYGVMDLTIIETARSLETQKQLVKSGASKTLNSKHLIQPDGYAHAVDIAPHPIQWQEAYKFCYMAGLMMAAAKEENVTLRWGGDWDRDADLSDNPFFDGPHFEMIATQQKE